MGTKNFDIGQLRVEPGSKVKLAKIDPASTPSWDADDREQAAAKLAELTLRLKAAQSVLWAQSSHRVLVVLQAMDAGGKDGTIRRVFEGVNPQGCGWRRSRSRPSPSWPTTTCGGSTSRRRRTASRHLQPQPLRGRAGGAGDGAGPRGAVGAPLPPHRGVRADAGRRGHHDREAVPPHLERGAAPAASGPAVASRRRTGSSTPPTWGPGPAGTTTRRRTPTPSPPPAPSRRRGTSCPADRKWYRNLAVSEILVKTLEGLKMSYPAAPANIADLVIPE